MCWFFIYSVCSVLMPAKAGAPAPSPCSCGAPHKRLCRRSASKKERKLFLSSFSSYAPDRSPHRFSCWGWKRWFFSSDCVRLLVSALHGWFFSGLWPWGNPSGKPIAFRSMSNTLPSSGRLCITSFTAGIYLFCAAPPPERHGKSSGESKHCAASPPALGPLHDR